MSGVAAADVIRGPIKSTAGVGWKRVAMLPFSTGERSTASGGRASSDGVAGYKISDNPLGRVGGGAVFSLQRAMESCKSRDGKNVTEPSSAGNGWTWRRALMEEWCLD